MEKEGLASTNGQVPATADSRTGMDMQVKELVINMSTRVNDIEDRVKGAVEGVAKLCSGIKGNVATLLEKMPQMETRLLAVEEDTRVCKQMLHEFLAKQGGPVSDASSPMKIDSDRFIYGDPRDNPFYSMGKIFLIMISSQPFPIDLDTKQTFGTLLKKYAKQCDCVFDYNATRLTEGSQEWSVEAVMTWKKREYKLAEDVCTKLYTKKEEIGRKLVMHLSKFCKIIFRKEFTELKCRPVVLKCSIKGANKQWPKLGDLDDKTTYENEATVDTPEVKMEETGDAAEPLIESNSGMDEPLNESNASEVMDEPLNENTISQDTAELSKASKEAATPEDEARMDTAVPENEADEDADKPQSEVGKDITEDSESKEDGDESKNVEDLEPQLINPTDPTLTAYKDCEPKIQAELFMIQDELIETFNNFVMSDELEDRIFMPDIAIKTQSHIKGFIRKEYRPWLDPVSIVYENQTFLVIRKIVNMQRLCPILESNNSELGPYRLMQAGKLKLSDFSSIIPEEQEQNQNTADTQEEGTELKALDQASTGLVTILEAKDTLSELPRRTFCNIASIVFPPVITDDTPLPESLEELTFLRNYSIVMDDAPNTDFRAVIRVFGEKYVIPINIAVTFEAAKEPGGASQWAGSVVLSHQSTKYDIGKAKSSLRLNAINDTCKNALVVLSRMCNIIIKKTRRENKHQQVYIDARGGNFRYDRNQPIYGMAPPPPDMSGGWGGQGGGPRGHNQSNWEWMERGEQWTQSKAYMKLTRVVDRFVRRVDLEDLVFSPEITSTSCTFIANFIRGKRYSDKVRLVNFTKNGKNYLSMMKIIHPKILTELLVEAGGEKNQYKLYAPRTLDISQIWLRKDDSVEAPSSGDSEQAVHAKVESESRKRNYNDTRSPHDRARQTKRYRDDSSYNRREAKIDASDW